MFVVMSIRNRRDIDRAIGIMDLLSLLLHQMSENRQLCPTDVSKSHRECDSYERGAFFKVSDQLMNGLVLQFLAPLSGESSERFRSSYTTHFTP